MVADLVEGLGDGGGGRRGLLPRVERHRVGHERRGRSYRPTTGSTGLGAESDVESHCVGHERRGCEPVDAPSRADHAAQRARHQEPLRDPLRPREHQPLHAGRSPDTLSVHFSVQHVAREAARQSRRSICDS